MLEKIPPLSVDLIIQLREMYPAITSAELAADDDQRLVMAGKHALIEFLETRLLQSQEDHVYS